MKKTLLVLLISTSIQSLISQEIKSFFYINESSKDLPVLLRGNLRNNIIIIFVQGGPGYTSIDFARADYPGWKQTLEKEVVIAYYDQRGLNKKINRIDSSTISIEQYSRDLITIAETLKKKYKSKIYLLGHSKGGVFVYHCLDNNPDRQDLIAGAILANTPMTNDYSPERFNHFRPLYLKNLAQEFLAKGQNTEYWQEAFDWMVKEDSIYNRETSCKWNQYVASAFKPTERKITIGMLCKVIFSRPYNPLRYFYNKDNYLVRKLFFKEEAHEKPFWEMKIKYPVLILSGRYDDVAPPEEMVIMNQRIKDSRLVIIPDAGHPSYLDQPEVFQKSILDFLGILGHADK
jgi:pimeloyl-ACP methyl ester carboxylesterase